MFENYHVTRQVKNTCQCIGYSTDWEVSYFVAQWICSDGKTRTLYDSTKIDKNGNAIPGELSECYPYPPRDAVGKTVEYIK